MTERKELLSRKKEVQAGGGLPPRGLRLLELNGCLAVFFTKQYKPVVYLRLFPASLIFLFSHLCCGRFNVPSSRLKGNTVRREWRIKNQEQSRCLLLNRRPVQRIRRLNRVRRKCPSIFHAPFQVDAVSLLQVPTCCSTSAVDAAGCQEFPGSEVQAQTEEKRTILTLWNWRCRKANRFLPLCPRTNHLQNVPPRSPNHLGVSTAHNNSATLSLLPVLR